VILPGEVGNSLLTLMPTRKVASLAVNFSHPTVSYTSPGGALPLHTFVRFEPVPGKEDLLREELRLLLAPTRAEPGCIRIHLYEALRGPLAFYIHSEWLDDGAFDAHPKLPHMTRFLGLVGELTTHPVKGIRTKQIG